MTILVISVTYHLIIVQPAADPSSFNGDFFLVLLSFTVLMTIPAAILTGCLAGFSAKGSVFSIERMKKEEKQGRIFILAWLAAMVLGFVGTGVLMSKFDFRYWAAVGISTVFLTILGLAVAFFASLIANR